MLRQPPRSTRPDTLFPSPTLFRSWLYVDDHCAAVHLVLTQGTPGEIYNIGAGNETPNRVLVDKLLALLGKDESSVDYVADRLGHDRRYSVDIAKVTALGWRRERSLDEALEATVDWYRAHEWRSEEHTSELQSLMRISYAVFCLKKKKQIKNT